MGYKCKSFSSHQQYDLLMVHCSITKSLEYSFVLNSLNRLKTSAFWQPMLNFFNDMPLWLMCVCICLNCSVIINSSWIIFVLCVIDFCVIDSIVRSFDFFFVDWLNWGLLISHTKRSFYNNVRPHLRCF